MAGKRLNQIKEGLKKADKSIYWLSKTTAISYSLLHSYVAGTREPGLDNLYKIAKALKVDPCELLNR